MTDKDVGDFSSPFTLDSDGYPETGMHPLTMEQIKTEFVTTYPKCKQRKQLFKGLNEMNTCFNQLDLVVEQWIGGSFASDETKPNDLDIVNIFSINQLTSIPEEKHNIFESYVSKTKTAKKCGCDSRILVDQEDANHPLQADFKAMRHFWKLRLGHSWNDEPRGIIVHKFIPDALIEQSSEEIS